MTNMVTMTLIKPLILLLRVSFGAVNFNNGNDNENQNLFNIDLDAHRNVSTDLSFDGHIIYYDNMHNYIYI